jgi:hypothetical protein
VLSIHLEVALLAGLFCFFLFLFNRRRFFAKGDYLVQIFITYKGLLLFGLNCRLLNKEKIFLLADEDLILF